MKELLVHLLGVLNKIYINGLFVSLFQFHYEICLIITQIKIIIIKIKKLLIKIWRRCYEGRWLFFLMLLWRPLIDLHGKNCIILKEYSRKYADSEYYLYNTYNEIFGYILLGGAIIFYLFSFFPNIHIKKCKIKLSLMWIDLMVFSACYVSYTYYVVAEAYRNKEKLTVTKRAVQNIRKQSSLISNRSFFIGQKR